ncbi:MAG: hypothetical protein ACP5HC_06285 [Caldisericum sp.]
MRRFTFLEKEFRRFKKTISKKRKLIPVEEQKRVGVNLGDLRMIYLTGLPCIYVIPVEEDIQISKKLFKCLILTEEIILGWLGEETPIIELKKYGILLVPLPFFVIFDENFLFTYTERIGSFERKEDLKKLIDYVKRCERGEKVFGEIQKEFFCLVFEGIKPFCEMKKNSYWKIRS